ncbi:hypothetical protein RDWZM_006723 [Blomia tropicalis]|uniref:Alpha-latrotoxin n=1 Tax=Blomia tropicalis TaxID=40697 RepID=A0A9Q0RNN6_BLOTA|nr:hypothetical protein RDWZM_006723 [Blomia tropicalis]
MNDYSSSSSANDHHPRLSIASSRAPDVDTPPSTLINAHLVKSGCRSDLLLHEAAIKNDIATAKKLISYNVDLNSKSQMDRAPIHWAIIHNNPEIVSLLIENHCDIETSDKFGMRPILMGAMVGNVDIVKMLINAGCDCRVANKKQYTVLHCAVKHDQNEMVAYFLDNVADLDINALNETWQTSLTMATINNNLEIVAKLIAAGADVNSKDKQGRTAAHWASFKGHHEVLSCLLQSGINADERDEDGKTALHLSAEYGFKKTSKALIEHNCDIVATDSKGRSALMIASALGYIEVVAMLIENGANLNSKDKNGNTAIHLCVMGNHVKMAKFLIENKVDINSLNARQQTPLVVAAELGHTEVADVLIKHKADLFATEKSGRTALYIASRGSFTCLVDMLIKAERNQFFRMKPTQCSDDNVTETYISTDLDSQTNTEVNEDVGGNNFQSNEMTISEPDSIHFGHIRKLLYYLSRNHLESSDWKQLARFWDFTEDQIKAIEHQYTGKTSYKDHAYRMLLIWLHGLSPNKNPLSELYDALDYINKHDVAEKIRRKAEDNHYYNSNRFNCRCLPAIPSGVCHYCSIL